VPARPGSRGLSRAPWRPAPPARHKRCRPMPRRLSGSGRLRVRELLSTSGDGKRALPGSVWRSMSPRSAGSPRPGINADGSGQIKGSGYSGGGLMSSTMVKIGPVLHRFLAVKLTDLQRGSRSGDGWVRLVPGLWHLAEATFLKTAIPLRPEARSRLLYRAGEAWPRALPLTRLTGTAIRSGPPCQHRGIRPGRPRTVLPCAV